MAITLAILGWCAFGVAVVLGLGLNLIGLFGNWIILGALGVVWALQGFAPFGWVGVVFMVVLAVLGEVLETAFAGYGARKFGGSRGSIWAALIGCIVGAIFLTPLIPIPLVGTVVGACIGAFGGAALYELLQKEAGVSKSLWTGTGAALGKIGGIAAKFGCGLAILATAWLTYS